MTYSLIIYDADGTLFDYDAAERWSFGQMCSDLGITFSAELHASYRQINHGIWKEFEQGTITSGELKVERYRRLFDENDMSFDPEQAAFTYLDRLGEAGHLIDGAVEHLEKVSGHYPLALLTNGVAKTQHGRLEASDIGRFFDPVIISEEVGCQKPDPRIFEILMEKTAYRKEDGILIIGDSLSSDIAGGRNYGIDTCLFDPEDRFTEIPEGAAEPTFRMKTYKEIEQFLSVR